MASAGRLLAVGVVCRVLGLAGGQATALALGEGSTSGEGSGASSSPVEGEELLPAEREAQLAGLEAELLEAELFGEGSSNEGSG